MNEMGFLNPTELVSRIGVQEGMRIADFGSGSGDIAILLAKAVGEEGVVTAIDVLPSALESLKAKAESAELKNIFPIRANLEVVGGSTMDDNSQDMIFMANILWQSDKKKEIIGEASRILKSGGLAIAVEWTAGQIKAGPPENMKMDKEVLKMLMTSAGLQFVNDFPAGQFHYVLISKKT